MDGKRLDLDAPLISVRRIAASSAQPQDAKAQSRGVENSGAVPFIWEKRPGYPIDNSGYVAGVIAGGSTAALNLPPGRILTHASQQKPDPARRQTPITRSSEEVEVEESDETEIYGRTGYLSSKAEGLISSLRLKSSICLFNPVSGMKVRDLPPTKPRRMSSPRVKISNDERIVEAVYRNRMRDVDYIQNDAGSKLSTEFNKLTYLIDSQTPEGSSSFHYSSADTLSSNKNGDVRNKSKSTKPGRLDLSKEGIGICWMEGSCSTSPETDRTHLNSSQLSDTSDSNPSLVSMTAGTKVNTDNDYPLLSEFPKTEGSVVAETSGGYQPQSKFSGVDELSNSAYYTTLNGGNKNGSIFKNSQRNHACLNLRSDGQEKSFNNSVASSLLSPPSPKPPSDSWLKRTLPSILAKGQYQQSFLGTKFHPKNQTLRASRGGQKLTIPDKSSKITIPDKSNKRHLLGF